MLSPYLQALVNWLADNAGGTAFEHPFFTFSVLVVIVVGFICGSIGTIVVGNRMAFFSDALAHCAFAGVALALLYSIIWNIGANFETVLPFVLVSFGVVFGILIAFVRENTSLSSDTVIGVFFAFALGLGGMVMKAVAGRRFFNLENFLFGDPISATAGDLEVLLYLAIVTAGFLIVMYNSIVFASFNASLARSRAVPTRFSLYLFIVLLGVIVNLCLQIVGVLLINGLLIVPAATAANVSKNMRQMFWMSIIISIGIGLCGILVAWEIGLPDPADPNETVHFGASGTTLVLSVLLFFISMAWRRFRAHA